MSFSSKYLFFFLFSAFILIQMHISKAEIQTVFLKDDTHQYVVLDKFSFTRAGYVEVTVSNVSVTMSNSGSTPNMSRIGLVAIPSDESYLNEFTCLFDEKHVIALPTDYKPLQDNWQPILIFDELPSPPSKPILNRKAHIKIINYTDSLTRRQIALINCNENIAISMRAQLATYNLNRHSGKKSYLSAGDVPLINVHIFFSKWHAVLLFLWIAYCLKEKVNVYTIHILMGALILFKALDLFSKGKELRYINDVGQPPVWDVVVKVSQIVRGTLFFCVFVLIGTGWQILKPCLHLKEKILLAIGLILQFIINVGFMELKPRSPFIVMASYGWVFLFIVLDIITITMILWPIKWQIKSLRDSATLNGNSTSILEKLKLFQRLFFAIIIYLEVVKYFPLFEVYLNNDYEYEDIFIAVAEGTAFIFYAVTFYFFRPNATNEYFRIISTEEEAIALQEIRIGFSDF